MRFHPARSIACRARRNDDCHKNRETGGEEKSPANRGSDLASHRDCRRAHLRDSPDRQSGYHDLISSGQRVGRRAYQQVAIREGGYCAAERPSECASGPHPDFD